MYLETKISTKVKLFYNLLISLFPIFFIAGNMLINIGTIVMCYLALIIPSSIITNMKLIDSIRFE